MALRLTREQISVSYNDGRGRPTRSAQKLDNSVKTAIEDAYDLQVQFNQDVSDAATNATNAANAALAASSSASTAASNATASASSASTAASQALTASGAATSSASNATAASNSATTAANNATTAANSATAAAGSATSAATAAAAAAGAAGASAASASAAAAFASVYGVALAGRAGTLTASPSGGLMTATHGYVDPSGGTYPAALQFCSAVAYGAGAFFVSIYALTSTDITFYLADTTGTAITGGSYTVIWRVCGA